jgi:hypothetical protein
MTRRGVVFVASKHDRYVECALLSAETIRQRAPDLSITLFTDRPGHPLCLASHFDTIHAIDSATGLGSRWAEGQLDRLRCLPNSPYDETLHLDTDTRVLTDELPWLFDRLHAADLAMVETAVDDSFSRKSFGRRMYNAGFILYRRNDPVLAWLRDWIALTEVNFRMARQSPLPEVATLRHIPAEDVRRRLLCMDQISLVELLSPEQQRDGLRVAVLDHSWNHRGSRLAENNRVPVRVLHAPALRELSIPDLMALAFAWRQAGRRAEASIIDDYIAAHYRAAGR